MSSWVVQIFAISDARAEELIVGLLAGISGVEVQAAASDSDRYVVTECGDAIQASSIQRIVTSIDVGARLMHTTSGPGGRPVRSDRVPWRVAG